jgi:hypothetical protein
MHGRTGASRLSPLLLVLAFSVVLAVAPRGALADEYGYHCPPNSYDTMTIGVNVTCTHGRIHPLTKVSVYRLNNTTTDHCAGSRQYYDGGGHPLPYVCGIGYEGTGAIHTPYYSNGRCSYPIHKNHGPYVGGFYSRFHFLNYDCGV